MNPFKNPLGAKTIDDLLRRLYDCSNEMDNLQEELAEAIEAYTDETDDVIAEMELYLEDGRKCKEINEMLYTELNAYRKELLRLIHCLKENGLVPAGKQYIHYDRLDPDKYEQDPESPFYFDNPDEHFQSLVQDQYGHLQEFEKITPLTMPEQEALLRHVICDTRLDSGNFWEWQVFLKEYKAQREGGRKKDEKN